MKKLAVANGQYEKDGQQKTRWVNVGVIGISQNGKEYMLIDPTINFAGFPREEGKDMVMVGIFDDSNQQQQSNHGGNGQQQQQQSYTPPAQEYRNNLNQLTDANGNLLLDQNGQPRY